MTTLQRCASIWLALLMAFVPSAQAMTWLRAPDFDRDVITAATRSFRGTVVKVQSRAIRIPGTTRRIPYTRVRIRAERGYHGVHDRQMVTLRLPGGVIPRTTRGMAIAGVATFRVGEEVAVFINDFETIHRLLGSSFGEIGVRRIERLADRAIVSMPGGAVSLDEFDRRVTAIHPDPRERHRPPGEGPWRRLFIEFLQGIEQAAPPRDATYSSENP